MQTLAEIIMNPGLNLNNLRYFFDAVETESISEAARRNYVTQSAVSQGIQKLEKALGFPLITHQRNCFKLTSEGQMVFSLTQQIFKNIKAMSDVAHQFEELVSGHISVVCTQSIAMNLISTNLERMQKEFPQVSLKMKIAKMENICQMLKRGQMDVGVVVESEICDQFERRVIRKGLFQVYSKMGNLDDGVYVDHHHGLYVDRLLEMYRKKFGKELAILQELDSWQVLAKCAENRIGCCFLPDFVLDTDSTLRICQDIRPIPYRIVAIYPKGVQLTRAAKMFLDLL